MNPQTTLPLSFLLCSSPLTSAFVEPLATSTLPSPRVAPCTSAAVGPVGPWRRPDTPPSRRRNSLQPLRMTEDEENNPLSRGIDSVSWLPSVCDPDPSRSVFDASFSDSGNEEEGTTETLPLFPLGGVVYTPNSEHVLSIFEPRYRQMYNDILVNGSKRFVVAMCHPSDEGRFARVGVLFSLEELKEVSEKTADRVKYICNHRVTGRVKLHKVLNPEAWESRDTYLKVKGTIIDDTGEVSKSDDGDDDDGNTDESIPKKLVSAFKNAVLANSIKKTPEEAALADSFGDLIELQHDLSEDVRFSRASVRAFGVAEGTDVDPNLWTSIRIWQSYTQQRLMAGQNEMQKEFRERLVEYLKKSTDVGDGEGSEKLPSVIGMQELSPELQAELIDLQKRMAAELEPLMLEQTLSMQKILEAADHEGRVALMRYFVDAERKRLQAKKTLKGMFDGAASAVTSRESDGIDETTAAAPKPTLNTEEETRSQFFADDDGNAFQ